MTRLGQIQFVSSRARSGLMVALCCLMSVSLHALQDLSPPGDPMKLIQRIADLENGMASADPATRETCEQELLAIGPVALNYLGLVRPEWTPATRERMRLLRRQLEKQAVESVSQPSRIRLQGEFPLATVLAEIEKQTGNRVQLVLPTSSAALPAAIRADWQNTSFWDVIAELERQTGSVVDHRAALVGQVLLRQLDASGVGAAEVSVLPGGRAGILHFAVIRTDASRNLLEPQTSGLTVHLRVRCEPRLRPLQLRVPLSSVSLEDSAGRTVSLPVPDGVAEAGLQAGQPWSDLRLTLPLPENHANELPVMRGRFQVLLPGRIENFVFDDVVRLPRGTPQTRADATVTMERITDQGKQKAVELSLSFGNPNGGTESHMGWLADNEVWLQTPDGSRILPVGKETSQQSESILGMTYLFDVMPDGASLVYRTPAAIVLVEVPFELQKVPFP